MRAGAGALQGLLPKASCFLLPVLYASRIEIGVLQIDDN
jgi:hypothetical protein